VNNAEIDEVTLVASDINVPKMPKLKVVLTNPFRFFSTLIALLLRYEDTKIVHVHFEITRYDSLALIELMAAIFAAKFFLRKHVLFSLYNPFFDPDNSEEYLTLMTNEQNPIKLAIFRHALILWYKYISKCSHRIIVHASIFQKYLDKLAIKNTSVLPHGYVAPLSPEPNPSGEYILVFGVISRRKRLDQILEAYVQQKPQVPLIVAGGASKYDKQYYQNLLNKYNHKFGITFTGFIPDALLEKTVKGAKLIILPQPLEVTPSGVLTQLAAYGKPILGPKSNLYFAEYLPKEALFDEILFSDLLDEAKLERVSFSIVNRALAESFDQVAPSYVTFYEKQMNEVNPTH
jgi:glycosyltransferase involved in cell wall biosynthesis